MNTTTSLILILFFIIIISINFYCLYKLNQLKKEINLLVNTFTLSS